MTAGRPRVSAVVTTYNCAEHVAGLGQRLAAMPVVDEIVIYDDASSDCTPALLKDLAAQDPRVTLVLASQNQGVAGARNEALARCRGEFVWFADPDDCWSPRLVEVLYQAVVDTGADIAVGRADQRGARSPETKVIDGLDRWAVEDRAATLELVLAGAMRGYLWNKLLRRSIVPAAPFPPVRSQSDFLGLIRTVGQSRSTVFVPEVLYTRVERPQSITRSAKDQVENLKRCVTAVESVLADEGATGRYASALRFFKVWFFAVPAANTPLRTGAGHRLVTYGIQSALAVVEEVPLWTHVRIACCAPRLELQVLCLLLLRGAYPVAYRAAKVLRVLLRTGSRGVRDVLADRGDGALAEWWRRRVRRPHLGGLVAAAGARGGHAAHQRIR